MPGRISDRLKGFYYLWGAYFYLLEKGFDIELWLTSEPEGYHSGLPGIHYMGWLPPSRMHEFYEAIDICVVPSIWQEPFGLVAVEAMASGRPVIATDVGGLGSIVDHGVTGLIVQPGSILQLAAAIETLITDTSLRHRMGQAAAQVAREKYSWDHIIDTHYLPLLADYESSQGIQS